MAYDPQSSVAVTTLKANAMSKTLFQSNFEEKIIGYCTEVSKYEIEDLELNRTRQEIGIYPSELHTYELISQIPQALGNEIPYILETNTTSVNQVEMVLKLAKPSCVLFQKANFYTFPVDYLQELGIQTIYIPNDENVFRAENIYLNSECPLEVYDYTLFEDGIIPEGIDMMVLSALHLSMSQNKELLSALYNQLPENGIIYMYNSNDFMSLYDWRDKMSKNLNEEHPFFDIHSAITQLPNALFYHIPTGSGFTIIVKQ